MLPAGKGERAVQATLASGGEVLLATGAIGTPQILQLSGIGPGDLLQQHGIAPVHALAGVGGNLQDHLQIRAVYAVDGVKTLNTMASSWWGKARIGLEYAARRSGPMSMAPSQLGAFTRSDPERPHPNLEYHVQPLSLDAFGEPLHRFNAFTASVCNLNPTSRGQVSIRSADPDAAPRIAPRYLSTDADRHVAAAGLRLTRRIVAQPALAQIPAAGGQARRAVPDRRRAGAARRRHRHDDLPSGRHREDGAGRRSRSRGRCAAAGPRRSRDCASSMPA